MHLRVSLYDFFSSVGALLSGRRYYWKEKWDTDGTHTKQHMCHPLGATQQFLKTFPPPPPRPSRKLFVFVSKGKIIIVCPPKSVCYYTDKLKLCPLEQTLHSKYFKLSNITTGIN